MGRRVLVINLKNYPEVLGDSALRLLHSAERVASKTGVELMVAPPIPFLASMASVAKVPILSQRVDDAAEGKSTGSVIPEALAAWKCSGSILNHSECRVPKGQLSSLVPRMKKLGLVSCLCVETAEELVSMTGLEPEYLAIEPPELIGTGVSVSKTRPGLVSDSVDAARRVGYGGSVLCGAGIVDGEDVRAAVRLGVDGVLVASSIVKAPDWDAKIGELASALL